jgi:hypothetical protein
VDEDKKRSWDVALGAIAPVITVAGLLVGVWQFNAGEQNRVKLENELLIRNDTIEFNRKLWLEKLETYKNLVILAGKIAAAVADPKREPAKLGQLTTDLTAAYWGQTVFVEDQGVADALREFYLAVRDFQAGLAGGTPPDQRVKLTADRLAQACKASISRDASEEGLR